MVPTRCDATISWHKQEAAEKPRQKKSIILNKQKPSAEASALKLLKKKMKRFANEE